MTDLYPRAEKYFQQSFDGIIRIELKDDSSSMWIDGRQTPPVISEQAPPNVGGSFCLWRATKETVARIFSPGGRQLEAAYIAGRLNISGDMSVLSRLKIGPA